MRYFIELSYKGTAYHGWQNQPTDISVQEMIEKALSTLLKQEIKIVGAGRTDTGVHAKMMVAHTDLPEQIKPDQLIYKMNSFLPRDISIHDIRPVKEDAHARFDAISRSYQYHISRAKDVFSIETAYYYKQDLDLELMNKIATILLDHRNFKCFSRSNTDVKTYNCNVMEASWSMENELLIFTIKADRFLRNMVRAVVGTLLEVGLGKMSEAEFRSVLESEDRSQAGPSAPAHGLFLTDITYPENIFIDV